VITGVFESIDREETKALILKHGGKVCTNVTRMTKYLVAGRDCGQSKLDKVCSLRLLHEFQSSHGSREFKASLEKSLNFGKLKKSFSCSGKRVEGLEVWNLSIMSIVNPSIPPIDGYKKVGVTRLSDLVTVRTSCHSCCKAGRRTA